MPSISFYLKKLKRAAIGNDLLALGWFGYASSLTIFIAAILIEDVFYLSTTARFASWVLLGLLICSSGFLLIIVAILTYKNLFRRYRWSTLARRIGSLAFPKEDAVLNALQLERSITGSASRELSQTFINRVCDQLSRLDYQTLLSTDKIQFWKKTTVILLTITIFMLVFTWESSSAAVYRWSHPLTEFPVPRPFALKSLTGDIHLLGGETTDIVIESIKARPDTVFLEFTAPLLTDSDASLSAPLILKSAPAKDNHYHFTLKEIDQDYNYRAIVPSAHIWETWKEVSSPIYRILVTDRPTLESFTITVIAPKYSGLAPQIQQGNQANVQGLRGSTIAIRLSSSRPLAESFIKLNDNRIDFNVQGKYADGEFVLLNEGVFSIHLIDRRGITNREPIPYHLQIIPDLPPELNVISPPPVIELGNDQLIPIHLDIEDDFGFSDLQVGYEIRRPSYLQSEPFISIFTIRDLDPEKLSQEIKTVWDLSELGLMPEDEVHYHFELYDNDDISGPKKTISGTFVARLPSLADLYSAFEEDRQNIEDEALMELQDLEAILDQLDKAELDLLKSDDLDWEQQQEIKKMLEKAKKEIEKLQKLAENLQTMAEMGEKHGLFSPELMEKFRELQELVNDLITADLLQNMERIEDALKDMDLNDLMSAMEQLTANIDQLERNLDRFIDIFKRIRAEQKLDEVVNRLEQLVTQQQALDDKVRQTDKETDPSTFSRLTLEEKWNLEEYQNTMEAMQEAARLMEDYSPQAADAMEKLQQSELAQSTESDLSQAMKQLKQQESTPAKQRSRSALKNLESMVNRARNIQQQFNMETASEMAAKLQSIMRDVLVLSKAQESLEKTTAETPRNSPRIRELAGQQQMLKDQLRQIMSAMMALSKETFAISPEMGKAMGMAAAQMEASKTKLAERNGRGAQSNQKIAMQSLNEAAMSIYNASQQMQRGGSASGFEQFLQQMQEMAGRQQGLNNQGMQLALGQMSAAAQQALLQRMLQGQQQVRKSLQQLMNEMKNSGNQGLGDLSGMAQEMDAVIKDLQAKKYSRKTVERQQRILSRMLDSQKSLEQRGYKDERTSKTAATDKLYQGPSGLPADLGQRRLLAMEALNQALKAGYSRDYQTMIRRYFNDLSQTDYIFEPTDTLHPSTDNPQSNDTLPVNE